MSFPPLQQQFSPKFSTTRNGNQYLRVSTDLDDADFLYRNTRRSRNSLLTLLRRYCGIRRIAILLVVLPITFFLSLILSSGIPSTYEDIRKYENQLPQHRGLVVSGPNLQRRRFLKFEGTVQGRGFNNVLEERIVLSYLALQSGRTYVFDDYVWSAKSLLHFTIDEWALRPSRIPINAFISGPSAGGRLPDGQHRAVNAEFFDSVCAPQSIIELNAKELSHDESWSGNDLMKWWIEKLSEYSSESCLVITEAENIFDYRFFGSPRVLSLLPDLQQSPILQSFTWSPLVVSALTRNFVLFQPSDTTELYDTSSSTFFSGLLAVHIRRGDYEGHCKYLFKTGTSYIGMNSLSSLPDRFDPDTLPSLDDGSTMSLGSYYQQHCFPSVAEITARLNTIRKANPSLNRIYVLSNAHASWLSSLSNSLEYDGWSDVKSTLNLKLDNEQRHVSGAVDMAIAQKAEVFVGNGFSSLSANIIMLRLGSGYDVDSNRFL